MKKSILELVLNPKRLSVVFQPIFRVKDTVEIYSLEALVREHLDLLQGQAALLAQAP